MAEIQYSFGGSNAIIGLEKCKYKQTNFSVSTVKVSVTMQKIVL